MSYAAGTLDPAVCIAIETHLAFCTACRESVRSYEVIGGALLDQTAPADLSDDALERVLAALDSQTATVSLDRHLAQAGVSDPELERLPEPVRGLARAAVADKGWRKVMGGIKVLDLAGPARNSDQTSVELFRLEPGVRVPKHTHHGQEFTLVLTGAFTDERGTFGPGDLSVGSPEVTHQPVADEGEVCHALAITTAPLKFTGALGLVQRVFGP